MKCPYQTKVIHIPVDYTSYAEDRTEFGECVKRECPFYAIRNGRERCRRAESEDTEE